ncbi:MAG: hypothetical protein IPG45_24265 [Deltaproteobacteria bacterium]|jgi:hypothetical protein|nr:hypothetical protein [Deltaproteobacteria bacterium]
MSRPKLGELLIKTGYLRPDQLAQALEEQKRWGGRIGRLFSEMRMVNEDVVLKALSKQLGLPLATLDALQVPSAILQQVDGSFALSHSLCPERYDQATRTLRVAMLDHNDVPAIDEIRRRTGLRIEVALAPHNAIGQAIKTLYGLSAGTRDRELSTSDLRGDKAAAAEKAKRESPMSIFETGDFGPIEDEHLTLDEPAPNRGKRR